MISHLTKAKKNLTSEKEAIGVQHRIEEKVSQEIKKVSEEIKTQTREEIAVIFKQRIKEAEFKRKKELDEEISRLEFKMQVMSIKKTGHLKRVEAYCSYILTE